MGGDSLVLGATANDLWNDPGCLAVFTALPRRCPNDSGQSSGSKPSVDFVTLVGKAIALVLPGRIT